MNELRHQIDGLDQKIVKLLGERMDLVKEIGSMKKGADLPTSDKSREKEIRENLEVFAKENDLSYGFVNQLYTHIFMESRRVQEESE